MDGWVNKSIETSLERDFLEESNQLLFHVASNMVEGKGRDREFWDNDIFVFDELMVFYYFEFLTMSNIDEFCYKKLTPLSHC